MCVNLQMIREDISLSNVEWEWNEETETLSKRVRKPDPNKATFLPKLLPIAEKRLREIRFVGSHSSVLHQIIRRPQMCEGPCLEWWLRAHKIYIDF